MCGRYRRTSSEESLARAYDVPIPAQSDLPISWNIVPSENVLAIRFNPKNRAPPADIYRSDRDGSANECGNLNKNKWLRLNRVSFLDEPVGNVGFDPDTVSFNNEVLSMKLGFICLNGAGHLNPMTALARQLKARNHEVIFLYSSEAAGLPVFPDEQNSAGQNATDKARAEVSSMQGEGALEFGIKTIIGFTESILNSLPTTVAKTGVQALLIDSAHFYVELGAIALGIPYIHVSNAMYNDYSGYTPLWLYGWPYDDTEHAIARNREGVARFGRILEKNRASVERYADRVGLKVDWADLSSTLSPLASVTQVPRAFDFESSHWPRQFYHTGPFHDGMGRTKVDFPWNRLTGQPLIYASMGTVLNGNLNVFQTIGTALTKHNDLQLVLSVGDRVDPQQIISAPKNAIIVQRAPQLELLKLASVCITHAGLNTVLESLAQGVPQVAIPIGFDQPGVAARIANKQTGVVISLDKLTPDHLSELVDELLSNSIYRANAQKLQRQIIEANGLSVAADVVEEALGVKKGCERKYHLP